MLQQSLILWISKKTRLWQCLLISVCLYLYLFCGKGFKVRKISCNTGFEYYCFICCTGYYLLYFSHNYKHHIPWKYYFGVGGVLLTILGFINTILSIAFIVLAIYGIVNAVQGKCKKLPIIGKFDILGKFVK